MKQNKLKTLALVLALALVVTLAVGMLVACNSKDDKSGSLSHIFSEDQHNSLVSYIYSKDFGEEYHNYMTICYFALNYRKRPRGDYGTSSGSVSYTSAIRRGRGYNAIGLWRL